LAGLERKNSSWLTEHAGEAVPDGMQRLIRKALFDIGAIRDDLAGYVSERLGEDGVLILDETGFVKKGRASAGVARQYSGTAGRISELPDRRLRCLSLLERTRPGRPRALPAQGLV
jgi:SRSO17 transposase